VTKISLAYDLANLQPADANPVESNFTRLEQHTNQEVIERDGSVAMRQPLRLAGDPVAPLDAAPKQYVDQVLPIGIIMPFGANVVPGGGKWLLCDGAEYQSADYPDLFAVIGTNYVAGTPSTGRFNVPQLMDNRFPMGTTSVGSKGGSADAAVAAHDHVMTHGHADVTSTGQSALHTHAGVDHIHGINLNTGQESAFHQHGPGSGMSAFITRLDGGGLGQTAAGGNYMQQVGATDSQNVFHYHGVNGTTGAADRNLTTSTESGYHVHTVGTPVFTGNTASSGVAAANANLPPYVGVAYVIRAK